MTRDDEKFDQDNEETTNNRDEEDDPFLKRRGGFGQGPQGGKLGSFMSKMGPILQNKDMFFSIIDNAVLPQVDEILDKYLYDEYLKHKAKYLYCYYTKLTEAGFSEDMAMKLVEMQSTKDSAFKILLEVLPDMIEVISHLTPMRKQMEREDRSDFEDVQ